MLNKVIQPLVKFDALFWEEDHPLAPRLIVAALFGGSGLLAVGLKVMTML